MRPVNLIPPEERRNGGGVRSGPLPYLILGALLAGLAAVVLLVTTSNQISSRETELAKLQRETASVEAVAHSLAPYVSFQAVSNDRTETITNLANSRFDWPKVMAQLALILPKDVELSSLSANVTPSVSAGGGESVALRGLSAGPGLSMAGCASSQQGVAAFLSALKEIDGVTRVGLQASTASEAEGEGGGSVSASGSCKGETTHFQIAVVFDAAPIAAAASGGETAVVAEAAPPAEGEEAATTETTSSEGE
jgi:Tfp pilus assembly protein PilN